MRAVLLGTDLGIDLKPLTCDLPNSMVPVLNRPIAEHVINLLKRHHINEIIGILSRHLPDTIRDYFQDGSDFGVQMTYVVNEDQPLGSAGSVGMISELLDDTFLVISSNLITDINLTAAIQFHKQQQSLATCVLTRVLNSNNFEAVDIDENYRISRFLENPEPSEIFSDVVNTHIYILEPEVLDYLPVNQESDFIRDLFPVLLRKGVPIYGFTTDNYWCVVNNLNAYRRVNSDVLHQKVRLEIPYEEKSPGLWIGQNTTLHPSVHIDTPALIGSNCRIEAYVRINADTVIGDNVIVGANATLEHPIIGNGTLIGEYAVLNACFLARDTRIDRGAQVSENAVVGALSLIGEEALVSTGVRVWPRKRIESGATLNTNLIWGQTAHRNLFGQRGIAGLANVDITPEFAVKLGVAYGSTLSLGASVTVSCDQHSISQIVSQSITAGLISVGINVYNLETTTIPVIRAVVPTFSTVEGVHIRMHPQRWDHILIEFLDCKGINLSKTREKKIEYAFFVEAERRTQTHELAARLDSLEGVFESYGEKLENCLNAKILRKQHLKVVIDYAYEFSQDILSKLLGSFGCDAFIINDCSNQQKITQPDQELLIRNLGQITVRLKATFGVQILANEEAIVLVDETGFPVRGETLVALMTDLILATHPGGTVVVPVDASSMVEWVAHRYQGRVIRTKANPVALMEVCQTNSNIVLGGSTGMGFIFPQLHPGFDAIFSIMKLIEMMGIQKRSLQQVRLNLPNVFYARDSVRCPWTAKGALMRHLVETHVIESLELIDGVKIFNSSKDSWILVLPDVGEPTVHIVVDSSDHAWGDEVLREYRTSIQEFIGSKEGEPYSEI